jgi:hypothetical protein
MLNDVEQLRVHLLQGCVQHLGPLQGHPAAARQLPAAGMGGEDTSGVAVANPP